MKSKLGMDATRAGQSPPTRGAWIEMAEHWLLRPIHRSPPTRGAWIEIYMNCCMYFLSTSPPTRGAWIEIKGPFKGV